MCVCVTVLRFVAYEPDRFAAWDVSYGPFRLLQRAEFSADKDGSATRLRLTIETRASGPTRLIVPLLRIRFRRTMENSVNAIRKPRTTLARLDPMGRPSWRPVVM